MKEELIEFIMKNISCHYKGCPDESISCNECGRVSIWSEGVEAIVDLLIASGLIKQPDKYPKTPGDETDGLEKIYKERG